MKSSTYQCIIVYMNTKNSGYTIEETKTVYEGRAFKVEQRRIRRPDGVVIDRDVVVHPQVVFIIVHRLDTDEYLIEREYRSGMNAVVYGLPAGFIDDGESPEEAAIRETREETGVVITNKDLTRLGALQSSQGFTDEDATAFAADISEVRNVGTEFDEDEQLESAWVSGDTLLEMVQDGRISGAVSVAAVFMDAARRLYERTPDGGMVTVHVHPLHHGERF